MNQAAQKQNPPSRRTKEELKDELEALTADNEAMLKELEELRRQKSELKSQPAASIQSDDDAQDSQQSEQAQNTKTVQQGEIDPVTGKLLKPPLSAEELAAEDEQIAKAYESMMDDGDSADTVVQPIETNRGSTMAKHSPAVIRPSMETDERDTGFHGKVQQFSDNRLAGEDKLIEHARPEDVIAMEKKQANIEFMKMPVTIHIMQASRADDDQMFSIGVNGRQWSFQRNKEYTVPRYVVEGLLRAKPMTYSNEEYTKSNGERDIRWPIRQGVRYPFAIVVDKYPKWREWMAFTMAQPD